MFWFTPRALLLLVVMLATGSARASAQATPSHVTVTGLKRTRATTLLELLPRPPPAHYDDAELRETERRISNLGIFDHVEVRRAGADVEIVVREKWTLIPSFDMATGKTLRDLYLSVGATEYNLFGTATQLGLTVYREQRGLGFALMLAEHESRGHRWAHGGEVEYGSAESRFPGDESWVKEGFELGVWSTSPPVGSKHLRFRLGAYYLYEHMVEVSGPVRPPDGHAIIPAFDVVWDAYRFHDLIPYGIRAYASAGPGLFVPTVQQRHYAELQVTGAQRLWWNAVLMARGWASAMNRGNANHAYLIGSITGVRGLPDAYYRNWLQSYLNVELRQAVPLWSRLALQFVAFGDAAAFAPLNARGRSAGPEQALSAGLGARLVPTILTELLLRFDVARLLLPEQTWFYQLGVSQYF